MFSMLEDSVPSNKTCNPFPPPFPHLGHIVGRYQHVPGCQVSMHHATRLQVLHACCCVAGNDKRNSFNAYILNRNLIVRIER